ncbi:peptidylprolyl isomerase [Mycolicibacterium sp.]|uniref:peptidylprolyl isomerase n=1 Tax=Mycolicibacterium sp. TaxID=2320850 RepID=UPI0028B0DC5B|nr:peptidylprolyl isomerase [Mycolicibacterium sp.]
MTTNAERREEAKRKLEQQLEQRTQQERRQRILTVVAAMLTLAVGAAAIAAFVFKGDKAESSASSASSSATSTAAAAPGAPTQLVRGGPDQLPAFQAPADLGKNCQYPAAGQKSKDVAPPNTGTVPTDPATISVSMATDQGNVGLVLNNAEAPCTVNSFASLSQKGYFNDTVCHRLTTAPDLGVLQCGDPTASGSGGPGYSFANEYPTNQFGKDDPALKKPVLYPRGALAMANAGPNTNGSQFFLVYKDSKLPPNYTVFGTIDSTGLATLDKIAGAGVAGGGQDGKPATEVKVTSILLD